MRKQWLGLGLLGLLTAATPSYAVKLTIACGALGQEQEICKQGAEAWAKKTGNEVALFNTPNDSGQQLALFQQMLAAGSADIDVYRIDVIWPGLLASHLSDLTPYVGKDLLPQHFAPIVKNNTVNGKLIAIPWFTDAGILFYRKDLLDKYNQKAPETWQELAKTAQTVLEGERKAGNEKLVGFVFQAKAYEGLTCNALEWVDSFGGGAVVDDSGKVTINNAKAAAAIDFMASLIGNVAPKGVLNYEEEDARGVFQSGQALFMRNWPYAWSLANADNSPIKGKVGVVALPMGPGGKHTGTLGGWQLSVSKYSKNQALAADLVKYLASPEEQKRRAIVGSFNPTVASLYKDADVMKANPFMAKLSDTFTNAVSRPSKPTHAKYPQVSAEFRNAVHATLSGNGKAADNLKALEQKLNALSRNGKW